MWSEAAPAVCVRIIAERWRHAPAKVTPQVFKSSTAVFFFFPHSPSSFDLLTYTSHLHSSFPTDHLLSFAAPHLLISSPVKWSLGPVWYPDQLPPSCRSVSLTLLLIILRPFDSSVFLSLSFFLFSWVFSHCFCQFSCFFFSSDQFILCSWFHLLLAPTLYYNCDGRTPEQRTERNRTHMTQE